MNNNTAKTFMELNEIITRLNENIETLVLINQKLEKRVTNLEIQNCNYGTR